MIFKAERPKQAQAQAQGNNTHLKTHQTIAHTIKNRQGNQQTIAEIT
jgi:hypothetical protein